MFDRRLARSAYGDGVSGLSCVRLARFPPLTTSFYRRFYFRNFPAYQMITRFILRFRRFIIHFGHFRLVTARRFGFPVKCWWWYGAWISSSPVSPLECPRLTTSRNDLRSVSLQVFRSLQQGWRSPPCKIYVSVEAVWSHKAGTHRSRSRIQLTH